MSFFAHDKFTQKEFRSRQAGWRRETPEEHKNAGNATKGGIDLGLVIAARGVVWPKFDVN